MKMKPIAAAAAFAILGSLGSLPTMSGIALAQTAAKPVSAVQLEKNKQLVRDLTNAMASKDAAKAASYLADGYIQHNPNVPTGKAGFLNFFNKIWAGQQAPGTQNVPAELIAEGDLVMAIFRVPTPDPADPSKTYDLYTFDAYRVQNGKIVEHWDGYPKRAPAPAAAR